MALCNVLDHRHSDSSSLMCKINIIMNDVVLVMFSICYISPDSDQVKLKRRTLTEVTR